MPAFSPTSAFREAAGFPREYANWNFEQFKAFLDRMNRSGDLADWLRDFAVQQNLERAQQGFASPEQIRARGEEVIPGIEDAITRRGGRLGEIRDAFGNRVSAGETSGRVFDRLNQTAGDIVSTGDLTQAEIDNLYRRLTGREDTGSQQQLESIGQDYGGFRRGVDETFGGLRGKNASRYGDLLRSLGSTYSDLGGSLERTIGQGLTDTGSVYGGLRGSMENMYRDAAGRGGVTFGGTRDELGRTVGGLERGAGQTTADLLTSLGGTYGGLKRRTGETFGDIRTGAGETFDEALKDVASLRPGSEAAAARAARSWAPVVAGTAGRLRAMGIGPNDPQYAAAMADVEARRAAAMDDASVEQNQAAVDRANALRLERQAGRERTGVGQLQTEIGLGTAEQAGTERLRQTLQDSLERLGLTRYGETARLSLAELSRADQQALQRELQRQGLDLGELDQRLNLGLTRQAGRERLRLGEQVGAERLTGAELANEIPLAIGQSDRSIQLGREAGGLSRAEQLRRLGNIQGFDVNRTGATVGNLDTLFNRTQGYRDQATQADLLERAMQNEDWETVSNLLREQNAEELNNLNLRNLGYNAGQDWTTRDMLTRDTAVGNLGRAGEQQYRNLMDFAGAANRFGNTAASNYGQTYQQEAPRGGWGTRAIIGAATPFLAMIPGAGPALAGAASALGGSGIGGMTAGGGGRPGAQGGAQRGYDFQGAGGVYQTPPFNPNTSQTFAQGLRSIFSRRRPPAYNPNQEMTDYYG